ncbi:MAG: M1 family metallopeptidase [Firmicutes bacterium]|nr:M1 family metallopeptidase [Bacillota bacterium]
MRKFFKSMAAFVLIAALALGCAVTFTACSSGDFTNDLSNYTIDAVLNDGDKTLDAVLKLDYRNNYDIELRDMLFHLYPAAYRADARFKPVLGAEERLTAYPNGESWGGISIKNVAVNGKTPAHSITGQDEDKLLVPLSEPLLPTRRITVEIGFSLQIPQMRHRFGWLDKTINLGNFYPIVSMFENGAWISDPYYSFGDPFYSEASNYTVSITAPSNYTAALSGAIGSTENLSGGLVKTTAHLRAARDFAIVLGEFNTLTAQVADTQILYYYHSDATPELSLAAARDSIKTFSDLFGAYPYKTYSVVETPFLNGGMEYPGLVYISDRLSGEIYREVIIHETAHQWWYAVVGNNQVAHGWLDETLAEYSVTLFYQHNPSYNRTYDARMADAISSYALYVDMFKHQINFTTVMNRALGGFQSAVEYTYMAYVKGVIMLDTLRASIGADAVIAALKQYYQHNQFKIAVPELLVAAFETASKQQLAPFFEAWVEGKIQVYAN